MDDVGDGARGWIKVNPSNLSGFWQFPFLICVELFVFRWADGMRRKALENDDLPADRLRFVVCSLPLFPACPHHPLIPSTDRSPRCADLYLAQGL
jgi:hypothetical protein